MTYTSEDRWSDAIAAFATAQRAARYAEGTVETRLKHLTRFADSIGMSPWRVTYEDIRGWLDRTTSNRSTMLSLRTSIRAFYRWATASGRTVDDPSAEPSYVTQQTPVPEAWRPELDAFRAYLRSIGLPRTTVSVRMAQLNRFARDNASLAPLDATFDDLIEWMSGKRWSPETRRAHRSALRTFYAWAVESGRIESSPAAKLPVVRRGTHLPRPALEEEYKKALAFSSPRERVALVLAAELGLRRMEVAQVHSKDLMNRNGEWTLTVHGKGAHQRYLPLAPNHVTMLRALPGGYVLPGQDHGHISPGHIGKLISRLLPAGVTMHALRHRFATRIYAVDRDVFAVQQLLGHASPATTQVYVRIEEGSMRRLVDAVAS
ncbi:site-specific recombinase XerD [Homoserinimonas aerilata]|uniref:Site-specific recombinase XerD n=1 Tax=Homoserinimonas aerilata TaxID=1162970 RepID=A0A542YL14_9MICO|nr:tyrosine-type recombinase/integrase [Homoserinimonas aerilata]TQL48782.1 site-specific recombinase XerD [Homoserinimonas aerilata]